MQCKIVKKTDRTFYRAFLFRKAKQDNMADAGDTQHPALDAQLQMVNGKRKVGGIGTMTLVGVKEFRSLQFVQHLQCHCHDKQADV